MKNKIEGRLQKLEALTGAKKDGLTVCVWEFGKEKPVANGEGLTITVKKFCDPSLDYNPGPVVLPKKPTNLEDEIEGVISELRLQGFDERQIQAMVNKVQGEVDETQKPSDIDRGRYRSRADRAWAWMS